MRRIWKPVCCVFYLTPHERLQLTDSLFAELDALQLEEEEEGPSYLADLNRVPDFVDEPPVEIGDVRNCSLFAGFSIPHS
jgi:hypothetical protein